MGKSTSKKGKASKKARRAAERRKRMLRRGFILLGVAILCIACLAVLARLGRRPVNDDSWYIRTGELEIAAPSLTESGVGTLKGMVDAGSTGDEDSPFAIPLPDVPSRAFDGSGAPDGSGTPDGSGAPGGNGTPDATAEPTPEPTPEPTATPAPTPIVTPQPTAVTLTITAAGDCTLGGSVNQDTYEKFKKVVQKQGYDYFFRNVRPVFEADDLTILNLEGPLTDTGKGRHGMYCFKGDPDFVRIMTSSSVELCNVANNHSMDFGKAGLVRTAEVLEQAGIGCCGYTKVYHGTVKGVRVTALGFDKWQNDKAGIVEVIRQERANCDLLIVNMHWGRERVYEPMQQQKEWGHAAIDAGADLVIGTHPHVYGGVELYKGKYIAYSLGNFCFGGNGNPSDKRCLMFQQTFVVTPGSGKASDGGINIIPCMVTGLAHKNNYQPVVMTAKAGVSLMKAMARYSTLNKSTLWMANSYPEQIGYKPSAIATTGVRAVDVTSTPVTAPVVVTSEQEALDDDALVGALDPVEDAFESTYEGTADADYAGDDVSYDAETTFTHDEDDAAGTPTDDAFGDLNADAFDGADGEDDGAWGDAAPQPQDAGSAPAPTPESQRITSTQVQSGQKISDEQRKASEAEAKMALYLDQMMTE